MEKLKYKVSIKKGYKTLFTFCAIINLFVAVSIVIFLVKACTTAIDYMVAVVIFLFFLGVFLLCVNQMIKSVSVYKGKIVYKTLFFQKVYQPIEVYCSKTKIEETEGFSSITEGTLPGYGTYDKVTTFYNKAGQKLFSFGLAYENVTTLEQNMINNRKSLNGARK